MTWTDSTVRRELPDASGPEPRDAPRFNWAIIGLGHIASSFAAALRDNTSQRLVAVGSRSRERAERFAREFDVERAYGSYEEAVADPDVDVVYIASPHSEHHDHALLALGAGKHVLVEKAFTRNAPEAEAVFDAAEQRGLFVMEAMWMRFHPRIAVVNKLIEDGFVGEVRSILADHSQAFDPDPHHRLFDPDQAGGALLDLGVYPVSFVSMLLGGVNDVTARGQLTDTGVDARCSIILEGEGGTTAMLHTSLEVSTGTTAFVVGSKGTISLFGNFYAPGAIDIQLQDGTRAHYEADGLLGSDAMAYEIAEVARCLAAGLTESPLMTHNESFAVMEILDQVRELVGVRYPGEIAINA